MYRASPAAKRLVRYLLGVIAIILIVQVLYDSYYPPNRIQHKFARKSLLQTQRRGAVKREFLHAWDGYQDHGWMADGLMPVTGQKKTQFCSWSATLVDSLDTLWLMDLHEEFDHAVNATLTIDFRNNANECEVSLFESTIRYLGGLLAAYDLSHEARLLPKLVEVGDMLFGAFNTSSGMLCSFCHLASKLDSEDFFPSSSVSMADLGSLYLEFGRLSQITHEPKYFNAIDILANVFARTQLDSTIPGLWPETLDARMTKTNSTFARKGFAYSLGAMSDSSYEYLLKGHMLMGGVTRIYLDLWYVAANVIRGAILFRAFVPHTSEQGMLFSGIASRSPDSDDILLDPRTQHLACFAGGLFAMSSRILYEPDDLEIGRQLTEGCIWAYQRSPTGIMPETFSLIPCPELEDAQCEWNQTEWNNKVPQVPCEGASLPGLDRNEGALDHQEIVLDTLPPSIPASTCTNLNLPPGYLSVPDPSYKLRPEAIESVFIFWRVTGNEYYRDIGWEMFESIIRHTRTPFGHSALRSVMELSPREVIEEGVIVTKLRARQSDDMESFWFAETLKYFYLLFSEVDLVGLDDFVFNTEAHPLRLTKGIRGF